MDGRQISLSDKTHVLELGTSAKLRSSAPASLTVEMDNTVLEQSKKVK